MSARATTISIDDFSENKVDVAGPNLHEVNRRSVNPRVGDNANIATRNGLICVAFCQGTKLAGGILHQSEQCVSSKREREKRGQAHSHWLHVYFLKIAFFHYSQ